MKKSAIACGLTLTVLLMGFSSCEKSDNAASDEIGGKYIGSFSVSTTLKSATLDDQEEDYGTAIVSMTGDEQIEVHCFGEAIDTTFMLDYYHHEDSVMVCLSGEEFTHMYGHRLGEGHMPGGMMGDLSEGDSEWMHHMDDEHAPGDDHFGGFDMGDHSFSYSFNMMNGSTPYYLKFHGVKQ